MKIVPTKSYQRGVKRLKKLGATGADIRDMENEIAMAPTAGNLVPGSGGLYKIRFGYANKGKRGGGRTIYYVWTKDEAVILLTVYAKVDKDDLTAEETKLFADLIKELTDGEED